MKEADLSKIRNFGIISHIDAGKTTVSERILYYTGEIHKMGEVHDGMAVMDWMEQEQQRGITITATATSCHWRDYHFNLIDTPGHIDFTVEVERSLRALDGAVAIFSAVEGVQPQSESVWRQADRYRVPRICLINKMDRVGADFERVLEDMEKKLAAHPVALQLPLGNEDQFVGVIDLVDEQVLLFSDDDLGKTVRKDTIPPSYQDQVQQLRDQLVEAAADYDDTILQDYLNGQHIETERLLPALRKGVTACAIFPVLVGSALRNKGIQPLLDSICALLPSPLDVAAIAAVRLDNQEAVTINPASDAPLCALAFKVIADQGRKLTYLRIYSGTLQAGEQVFNSTTAEEEKIARLFRMHAHKRERIDHAQAGDIVAVTGLKQALTGDTFCAPDFQVKLSGLSYPEPVVSQAVEARTPEGREKLPLALEKLQWEDPTFKVREDPDTGQTILTGMGELHLEVVIQRLKTDFGIDVSSGRPQVVFRETIASAVSRHEIYERELDGTLHYAEVAVSITPRPRKSGLQIAVNDEVLSAWPPLLAATITRQLQQACLNGPLAGYPLTDLLLELDAAPFDPNRTTELGVTAALHKAVQQGLRQGKAVLLEPLMALELIVPSDYTGRVMGGLSQKRGQIEGISSQPGQDIIRASVPLLEMFGYMTELRSATKGKGSFTMEFSHYAEVPPQLQSNIAQH